MIEPKENCQWLLERLSCCDISSNEFEYRKLKLQEATKMPQSSISMFNDRYFSLAHEIKSFYFLRQFGNIVIAQDSKNEVGCDCTLMDYYQIECICCSGGEHTDDINFIEQSLENADYCFGDYNESFYLLRLTNSIDKKLGFYNAHIEKGTLNPQLPYLIFWGLGSLAGEMFVGENGIDFTSILFGKGYPTLCVNSETNALTFNGYSHNNELIKHNQAKINCNIFSEDKYRCVSGIIISSARLDEDYTPNNTWLFINPNARVKVDAENFSSIVYWDRYSDDEYGPYQKKE
jgi:hypothetical protein